MNPIDFGIHLRSLRKSKNLTLVQLSELSGVSNPYLSQLENGKSKPSPEILSRISHYLGTTFTDLMVKAGHIPIDDADDRSWDELMYGPVSEDMIKTLRDLNLALQSFHGNYYYNGHLLTKQDKHRIQEMLKALFPEYQNPPMDPQAK